MKKIISLILLLSVLMSLFTSIPVFAESQSELVNATDEYEIYIDNIPNDNDKYPVKKLIYKKDDVKYAAVYVPMRFFEQLDCSIEWVKVNDDGGYAICRKGLTAISVYPNHNKTYINDILNGISEKYYDEENENIVPINVGGILYVPLRKIAEIFFAKVETQVENDKTRIDVTSDYSATYFNGDSDKRFLNVTRPNTEKFITEKFIFDKNYMKKVNFKDKDDITVDQIVNISTTDDRVCVTVSENVNGETKREIKAFKMDDCINLADIAENGKTIDSITIEKDLMCVKLKLENGTEKEKIFKITEEDDKVYAERLRFDTTSSDIDHDTLTKLVENLKPDDSSTFKATKYEYKNDDKIIIEIYQPKGE